METETQWEYEIISEFERDVNNLEQYLNEKGKSRWELITIEKSNKQDRKNTLLTLIFKRALVIMIDL